MLALALSQGILLHSFKHQNTMGSGSGVTIGRTLCEANAVPDLSCSSSAKKVARVCMAFLLGLYLLSCGFFSQGCLGSTYLNNRLKMRCAASSEIAAPLFEHGLPSSSVKGKGFRVTSS